MSHYHTSPCTRWAPHVHTLAMRDTKLAASKKNDGRLLTIPHHHLPSIHCISYGPIPFSSSCPMLPDVFLSYKQSTYSILVPYLVLFWLLVVSMIYIFFPFILLHYEVCGFATSFVSESKYVCWSVRIRHFPYKWGVYMHVFSPLFIIFACMSSKSTLSLSLSLPLYLSTSFLSSPLIPSHIWLWAMKLVFIRLLGMKCGVV